MNRTCFKWGFLKPRAIPKGAPQVDRTSRTGPGIHQKRMEGSARAWSQKPDEELEKGDDRLGSNAELAFDGIHGTEDALILRRDQTANLPDGAHYRGVVLATEALT